VIGLDPWLFPLSEKDFEAGLTVPAIFLASHEYGLNNSTLFVLVFLYMSVINFNLHLNLFFQMAMG
jgi:hypothetical protein